MQVTVEQFAEKRDVILENRNHLLPKRYAQRLTLCRATVEAEKLLSNRSSRLLRKSREEA
jgi:hypothetical protein